MARLIDEGWSRFPSLAGAGCLLLLAACQGTAPEPDPTVRIEDDAAQVRQAVYLALNRDGWEVVGESTGVIRSRNTVHEASPPELLAYFDATRVNLRYGGGMTASAEQSGRQPFVHALPRNVRGHAVVAAYVQSPNDHYAEQVSDRCEDIVSHLRKIHYRFAVSIVCEMAAIPLTGAADPGVVKAAAMQAMRDHEWEIFNEQPGSFLARIHKSEGQPVQVRVAYDSHKLVCQNLSGVEDFVYRGVDAKPVEAEGDPGFVRFGHWMHIFDVDARVYLASLQFQSPRDVLKDASEQ